MERGSRPRLTDWAADSYSQNGEDGMLAEVLRRLELRTGLCVDVGAHDGFTFSNTARLWHDGDWRAVLVEPDRLRHETLVRRAAGRDVTVVQTAVRPSGPSSLAAILDDAGVGREVDVLSIDVDGDDVAILRSLTDVRCRVVVCEYNPTIPHDVELEGAPGTEIGCSLRTLVTAADGLGYALVGATGTNGVFVRREDAGRFDDLDTDVRSIAPTVAFTYVISDYHGRAAVVGPMPYRFRPGRLSFVQSERVRADVRMRWTPRGVVDALAWKTGTVGRHLLAVPRGERVAFVTHWIRSRR